MTLIFTIFLLVLIGCCVIRYPETVTGSIELESSDSTGIYGSIIVSTSDIGKINAGQSANIRLSGFPYFEFGILKGVISNVSYIPETTPDGNVGYLLDVQFTDGLRTSYKKDLPYIQGMDGTAEIITDNRLLITVFFAPIRSLLRNRKL